MIFRNIFKFFYFNKTAGLFLLFILAIIVRLVAINMLGGFSAFNASDTGTYLVRAKSLLNGNMESLSAFGFTFYLALIFKLCGQISLITVKEVNILLSSITVLVIFAVGNRFYNKGTGIIAAFICIFHINLVFWSGYILTETPFLLFLSLSVFYFFKFYDDKKLSSILTAFTVLALCALMRDIGFLLFVPASIWTLFILTKRRLTRALLIIFPLLVFLFTPWFITHKLLPAQVNTAIWVNNTVNGEVLKGLLWNESGRGTSAVDIKPEFLPLKIKQYTRNPYAYTELMLKKMKVFWWFFTPEMSWNHKLINALFLGLLYILALLGVIFCRAVGIKSVLLIMLICFFTFASMIGIVDYDLRYHLPTEILINVFSAYGVIILLAKLRKTKIKYSGIH